MAGAADIRGRVALVTGGSRGIGAAVALALANAGANVAINYVERADAAARVAEEVEGAGARSLAVRADVSKSEEVAGMIGEVAGALGPVDILINNAGIGWKRDVEDISEADWNATIAVNLTSAFLCTQAVFAGMKARGWGRIVNITSGAARGPGGIGVHYNASKAGMEGLTRGYASKLAKDGITVNAVAPSLIVTDMLPASLEDVARRVPAGRAGTAEEVADMVVAVVANAYMTGQTVQLNGGLTFI